MDYLHQILELAEAGNWNGIWSLVLVLATTIITAIGGIGGFAGIIAIGKALLSNKRLINKLTEGFKNVGLGTQAFTQNLLKENVQELKEMYESIIVDLKEQNKDLKAQMFSFMSQQQAFNNTILNTDALQLKYQNELKTLALKNKQAVNEEVAEVKEEANAVVRDFTEEVAKVVETEVKKQIRLKRKG